jgi:hypothetical protein
MLACYNERIGLRSNSAILRNLLDVGVFCNDLPLEAATRDKIQKNSINNVDTLAVPQLEERFTPKTI